MRVAAIRLATVLLLVASVKIIAATQTAAPPPVAPQTADEIVEKSTAALGTHF